MASWNDAVATREEQRELKRRALLRVAARIFNKKGFYGTSLDEIAETLGVTKTALYYYVKGKDELLYECLSVSYDCGFAARTYAEEQGGKAIVRFYNLYRRFIELLMTEGGAYTTMGDVMALPVPQREELLSRRGVLDRYSRQLLRQAIEDGDVRSVDVRLTSNYFLGAVNWILRWYSEGEAKTPAEVAETFLDLFFNGLGAGGQTLFAVREANSPGRPRLVRPRSQKAARERTKE